MKKLSVIVAILFLLIAVFTLRATTQARADNTCIDNCTATCGHCTWVDAGVVYVCPPGYAKKQYQE